MSTRRERSDKTILYVVGMFIVIIALWMGLLLLNRDSNFAL